MKTHVLVLTAAVTLTACSRNPDPEYAPDADTAPAPATVVAEAPADAPASVAVAPDPEPAADARLSDEETIRLGREAVAFLFAGDMDSLWARFDSDVRGQLGSAEAFGQMTGQIFSQIGEETELVEEEAMAVPQDPSISIYRRQAHYAQIGQDTNLNVAFNADGSIAGVFIQPVQP